MMSIQIIIIFIFATLTLVASDNQFCAGCTNSLDGERLKEAEEELNKSLTKLSAGTGPYYKLAKVNRASTQVVNGVVYRINADLIDSDQKTKNCDIRIHSQPWLENGIDISFRCAGEAVVSRKHSA